jgi:hypothetical protein
MWDNIGNTKYFAAKKTAEECAVSEYNALALPVYISGASGANAHQINGFFETTHEKSDGRVLLRKRGDASIVIEYFGTQWQVKLASSVGKFEDVVIFAMIPFQFFFFGSADYFAKITSNWPLEWILKHGDSFINAPGVKMVTGAEAEQKVSGCSPRVYVFKIILPPVLPQFALIYGNCAGLRACRCCGTSHFPRQRASCICSHQWFYRHQCCRR